MNKNLDNMRKYLIFLLSLKLCSGDRFLVVFPVPGGSHSILGDGYVRHLLKAGHEVTYITPFLRFKPSSKLQLIDVSNNANLYSFGDILNIEKIINKEIDLNDFHFSKDIMVDIANATITDPNVKKLMQNPGEKFDAVIVDWLYTEIYSGFSLVFDCPLIWASPMDLHAMVLSLIDEIPSPAYTAGHFSSVHPPFTLWQRIKELWDLRRIFNVVRQLRPKETQIYNEGFGPFVRSKGLNFVALDEIIYNGSLMLGNTHASFGQALQLPPNYKHILGYHIPDEIQPLPEGIQKIMDGSTNGVIYFSMGSLMNSKSLPTQMKRDLLSIFESVPHMVIWKLEETIPNVPSNVHIVNWAPQTSVLAHPNCILFITHGGLLSMTEAIHFGVPVIGVPGFADQFLNVDRAVNKGFGRKVELDAYFTDNLKIALEDVLGNSSYGVKAKEVSFVYHHRPVSPGAELVHWVEHVVRTRGALHLRSPALHVPFYQKYYLDLAALVATILVILAAIAKRLTTCKKVDIKKKNK